MISASQTKQLSFHHNPLVLRNLLGNSYDFIGRHFMAPSEFFPQQDCACSSVNPGPVGYGPLQHWYSFNSSLELQLVHIPTLHVMKFSYYFILSYSCGNHHNKTPTYFFLSISFLRIGMNNTFLSPLTL